MSHHPTWLDSTVDKLKPQPAPPPRPNAPPVDQTEWRNSVEQKPVVPDLTVHDVGLSVFGETRSLRDRPSSNEPIGSARQKIAQAMINDAELSHRTGKPRNKVHDPVEPSDDVLRNPEERAAYESSLRAAREAYLNGHDPTPRISTRDPRLAALPSRVRFPLAPSLALTTIRFPVRMRLGTPLG